ncbi:MAG: TPM domain-containing protein [Oscillospiraceae bacterium]|nr:TPM domain-containing protein [Oscillospiraceae bacterium]
MKKKKLIRMLSAAAALLISVLLLTVNAAAAREETYIPNCKLYDEDGLFDEIQTADLNQKIRSASDYTDMYVAVVIYGPDSEAYSDNTVKTMAMQKYLDLFQPKTKTDADGLLLILNLSTRYAYIATSGMGQLYYSNADSANRIDKMIENMKSSLRAEDYKGAIMQFCNDVINYYDKGIPRGAYTKDDQTGEYFWEENGQLVSGTELPRFYGKNWPAVIGISAGVGLLTALITALIIRSRYKLVKSLSATNYISQNETQFYERNDMFIRTHTSKTRIDSGGSGGGGGGGHSSSFGGHSFGGGGGHW